VFGVRERLSELLISTKVRTKIIYVVYLAHNDDDIDIYVDNDNYDYDNDDECVQRLSL